MSLSVGWIEARGRGITRICSICKDRPKVGAMLSVDSKQLIQSIEEALLKAFSNIEYQIHTPRQRITVEEHLAQVNRLLHEVAPETIRRVLREMQGGSGD